MSNNKIEDKKEVKRPTAEDFAKKYQELCEEMGFRIVVSPQFASTSHGSFEVVLQHTVGKLPDNKS